MKKQHTYFLYFLRAVILILIVWLLTAVFSPAINSEEQLFQKEVIQNQQKAILSLKKASEIGTRSIEKAIAYRPDDKILLESYLLIEKECHLTLDTLNELFSNTVISNQQLTEDVHNVSQHLKENVLAVLNKMDRVNPIIRKEEVMALHEQFPLFSYDFQNTNQHSLIHELIFNQIEQIKLSNLYYVSSKIGRSWFHTPYSQPSAIPSTFRKGILGQIKVILSTSSRDYLREDSLKINHQAFHLKDGVARYKAIYNDTLARNIIVEGDFIHAEDSSQIMIQDTFRIYPNHKY